MNYAHAFKFFNYHIKDACLQRILTYQHVNKYTFQYKSQNVSYLRKRGRAKWPAKLTSNDIEINM